VISVNFPGSKMPSYGVKAFSRETARGLSLSMLVNEASGGLNLGGMRIAVTIIISGRSGDASPTGSDFITASGRITIFLDL